MGKCVCGGAVMAKFDGRMNSFWVVVSEDRGMSFQPCMHPTEASAFAEAERLAQSYSGKFYVLESKGYSQKVNVRTVRCGQELPF